MTFLQKLWLRSSAKQIFKFSLKGARELERVPHRTCSAFKYNHQSQELNGSESVFGLHDIRKLDTETLRVTFSNNTTCDFKNIWLRDSCQCEQCVHPVTKQKLINIRDLDISVQPLEIIMEQETSQPVFRIHWPESLRQEAHYSTYSAEWLYQFRQTFEVNSYRDNIRSLEYASSIPKIKTWNSDIMNAAQIEIAYQDFMLDQECLLNLLSHLNKYGIALIKGVPIEMNQVLKVAKRISFVKQTTYGKTFQVINNPDPKAHLSYTGRRFELHTDLAYMQNAPSVQILHCLEAADPDSVGTDAGGISFFADAFHAAAWLREQHPHYFHILSNTKLLLTFQDAERGRWFRMERPLIEVNRNGDLIEFYWSDFSMRPPLIPSDQVVPFYKAYRCISDKLNEETSLWKFFLKAGDLVIFNNKRVLHGRDEYDATRVKRHLEGCYIDLQEALSLYESMLKSKY